MKNVNIDEITYEIDFNQYNHSDIKAMIISGLVTNQEVADFYQNENWDTSEFMESNN